MDENNIIFMTGATSGLGKVSALKSAKEGATLLVMARNKKKGEALLKEFNNQASQNLGNIKIIEGNPQQ